MGNENVEVEEPEDALQASNGVTNRDYSIADACLWAKKDIANALAVWQSD